MWSISFVLAFLLAGFIQEALVAPTLDPNIVRQLREKRTTNVILSMKETTILTLDRLKQQKFATRADRLNSVAQQLKDLAAASQKNLVDFLEGEQQLRYKSSSRSSFTYEILWITNQIIIRGADMNLLEKLVVFKEVGSIGEEIFIRLEDPINMKVMEANAKDDEGDEVQWGVQQIEAPAVWEQNNNRGENIIVATVDTGVRVTHESLKDNYVGGDYGWFDPAGRTQLPNDQQGHGTHVTANIVGSVRNIGVAPGSKWMSCKGCATIFCSQFDLFSCGQWMACPTKADGSDADCARAPHIVSNSWGGASGSAGTWYGSIIRAYEAAGIIPLFSIGNSGPSCGSSLSPGDYENVIGVGSTTIDDTLSEFSSLGPTILGFRLKPDIAAPGSDVFSAHHTSDTAYALKSGTSMACPHAAGVVSLLLSENPSLTYDQVRESLIRGSVPTNATGSRSCGDIPDNQYPNNHAGHGRINALKSIHYMKARFSQ